MSKAESAEAASASVSAPVAGAQLRSIVERIEHLEGERKALGEDVREIFAEAKSNGFDSTALREVLKLRKQDPGEREEQETLVGLYLSALGNSA